MLSKQDIESTGFICAKTNETYFNWKEEDFQLFNNYCNKARLVNWKSVPDNLSIFIDMDGDGDEEQLFRGNIENLEELKFILIKVGFKIN
jgi:hypothetical protein